MRTWIPTVNIDIKFYTLKSERFKISIQYAELPLSYARTQLTHLFVGEELFTGPSRWCSSKQRCGWRWCQDPQESARWWFQTFFNVHPYLGKESILTNIFQMGWNHQLECEKPGDDGRILLNQTFLWVLSSCGYIQNSGREEDGWNMFK